MHYDALLIHRARVLIWGVRPDTPILSGSEDPPDLRIQDPDRSDDRSDDQSI